MLRLRSGSVVGFAILFAALTGCSAESSEEGDSSSAAATTTTPERWDVELTAVGAPRELALYGKADVTMVLKPTANGADVTTEDLRIRLPAAEFARDRQIVVGNNSPASEDWTPNFGMEFSYRALPDGEWVVIEPSQRGTAFTGIQFTPTTCDLGPRCGDRFRRARGMWEGPAYARDELGQLIIRPIGDQYFSLPEEGAVELRILVRPIRWKPESRTLSTWVSYYSL